MFFFKKKENLFVDILDLKVDCSEIINIKEAKLVYVNGKGKLTVEIGKTEPYIWRVPSKIKLNDIPLIQSKVSDIPTWCN